MLRCWFSHTTEKYFGLWFDTSCMLFCFLNPRFASFCQAPDRAVPGERCRRLAGGLVARIRQVVETAVAKKKKFATYPSERM